MDLQADRFIALSPLSSAIWATLSTNGTQAALEHIMSAVGATSHEAASLFRRQITRWQLCGLTQLEPRTAAVPTTRPAAVIAPRELSMEAILHEPLNLLVVAELFVTEAQYRWFISKWGLAKTLCRLQDESGRAKGDSETGMRGVVRNYHASRRLFRQGVTARDCLHRSLALAAVLRRRSIDAHLCIGIIDLPFAAHAWVEAHDLIINESAELHARYTPIGRF